MIKRFLIVLTMVLTAQVNAQVWSQVGNGLFNASTTVNMSDVHMTSSQGKVYAAYLEGGNVVIKSWDGLTWTRLPSFVVNGIQEINDLAVTSNGDVYLCYNGISSGSNVGKLSSNNIWSLVLSPGTSGEVRDLFANGNNLYMAGTFNDTSNQVEQVCYLSGSALTSLKTPLIGSRLRDLTTITKVGGELMIAGSSRFDTVPFLTLDSALSSWSTNSIFVTGYNQGTNLAVDLFTVNQRTFFLELTPQKDTVELFEIVGDSVYIRDNQTLSSAGGLLKKVKKGAVRDSSYFFVVGSRNVPTYGDLFSVNNASVTRMNSSILPATPGAVTVSDDELFLLSKGMPTNAQLHPNATNFAYSSVKGFVHLSGKVFVDDNLDCNYTAGEVSVPSVLLGVSAGAVNYNFASDSNGNYRTLIPSGTYTFALPTSLSAIYSGLSTTCALPSSISLSANQNFSQDIPMEHHGNVDVRVALESHATGALFGFVQQYSVVIQNPGIDINGLFTVEVTLPSTMPLVSSNPQSTSVQGYKHTFTFNGIQRFEEKTISLLLRTSVNGNALGDTLTLLSQVNGITGDVNLNDNLDTLKMLVVGAYDPNDKTPNETQIAPGTNQIDYRIRFQNTGTAPAVKVTVVDTLDLTLPITSIIMNSASHPYSISVQNNILIWEFDNIMLPDSGTDQLGSQGYISFSAGLNPSLGLGDSILNDAEIYFDYQKPVHTNKARTLIVDNISQRENPLNSLLELYPNPTRERLFVKWKGQEAEQIQLLDVNGKTLNTFLVKHDVPFELDVQHLPPGVYFLKSAGSTTRLIVQ